MKKLLLTLTVLLVAFVVIFFVRTADQGYDSQPIDASGGEQDSNFQQETPPTNEKPVDEPQDSKSDADEKQNILQPEPPPVDKPKGITITEISKHDSESDCWIIYDDKVYDITSYLPKHPGTASRISPYCGTDDFQKAFEAQHKKSKVSLLMKVGTLMGDFDIIGDASP